MKKTLYRMEQKLDEINNKLDDMRDDIKVLRGKTVFELFDRRREILNEIRLKDEFIEVYISLEVVKVIVDSPSSTEKAIK